MRSVQMNIYQNNTYRTDFCGLHFLLIRNDYLSVDLQNSRNLLSYFLLMLIHSASVWCSRGRGFNLLTLSLLKMDSYLLSMVSFKGKEMAYFRWIFRCELQQHLCHVPSLFCHILTGFYNLSSYSYNSFIFSKYDHIFICIKTRELNITQLLQKQANWLLLCIELRWIQKSCYI